MDAQQERDEPQRREGFGGRVRRFIDNELSRAVNKDDPAPDAPAAATPDTPTPTTPNAPATPAAATPDTPTPTTPNAPATPAAATPDAPVTTTPAEDTTPRTDKRLADQAAADGSAERVGLLNDPAGLRDQWQQVQGTFVDDPQRAVHEASVLVDRTLREIHENVSRGQISDPTSTEDLRVSFQRYREFFQRLLSA
jgi:hypothetical protein